jgi:flagellar biosynthesis/type III secretory pathway M-ring protein FliF/YscJ
VESSQNQYRAPTDYNSANHPASHANPVNGQVHTERPAEKQRTASKESTPDWRNPEWAIVYATLALVLVSGVQIFMFYRQLRYMQTGMEDAKTAAEAAKSAATAATETLKARRAWITSVGYAVVPVGWTGSWGE